MPQSICLVCGSPIEFVRGRPPTNCWSDECRRAYQAAAMRKHRAKSRTSKPNKPCAECNQSFAWDRDKPNKRYCSPTCARSAHLRRRRDREYQPSPIFCAQCGSEIQYKSGKRRFCSAECQRTFAAVDARWRAKRLDPATIGLALQCALCGAADRSLEIDHDHDCCKGERTCGKCFRGMLCRPCNVGLGMFKDSPTLLRKAARYIAEARRKRSASSQPNLF